MNDKFNRKKQLQRAHQKDRNYQKFIMTLENMTLTSNQMKCPLEIHYKNVINSKKKNSIDCRFDFNQNESFCSIHRLGNFSVWRLFGHFSSKLLIKFKKSFYGAAIVNFDKIHRTN